MKVRHSQTDELGAAHPRRESERQNRAVAERPEVGPERPEHRADVLGRERRLGELLAP